MAIQTQGHQVQVMPQYTAMDPRMVTFNPAGFTQGALSSLELFDQLAKQKAFQQAQMELAATREGRLGAMNAQNLAAIKLAPERNIADILLAQNTAALAPGARAAAEAAQQDAIKNFQLIEALREINNETKGAQASAANVKANVDNQTASERAALEAQSVANQTENAPQEQELKRLQLSQNIESIISDKAMSDQQKLANIRLANANADQSLAAARRADRDDTKALDPYKRLDDIQMQIQRLKSEPVINPGADNLGTPMPVIQYQGKTRAPDGSILQQSTSDWYNPLTYGDKAPAPLNQSAEDIITQIAALEAERAALTSAIASPRAAAPAPAAPAARPAAAPKAAAPAKSSSGAKQITSKAEFDKLEPGDSFIYNGQAGIKTK